MYVSSICAGMISASCALSKGSASPYCLLKYNAFATDMQHPVILLPALNLFQAHPSAQRTAP